ncbi:MAG: hypothetical protein ACJ746_18685 [Bryobacteraceae bacterium]
MYSKGSGRCRRQKWLDIYYCRSQHKGGSGCGAPKLSREVTDYSLSTLISEMFLEPTVLGSLIEKAFEPPERSPIDEMVGKAATELERLKAENQWLLSLTLKGVFSDEEVATEARRIDAEIRSWSALVSKDQQQSELRSAANVRETAQTDCFGIRRISVSESQGTEALGSSIRETNRSGKQTFHCSNAKSACFRRQNSNPHGHGFKIPEVSPSVPIVLCIDSRTFAIMFSSIHHHPTCLESLPRICRIEEKLHQFTSRRNV